MEKAAKFQAEGKMEYRGKGVEMSTPFLIYTIADSSYVYPEAGEISEMVLSRLHSMEIQNFAPNIYAVKRVAGMKKRE